MLEHEGEAAGEVWGEAGPLRPAWYPRGDGEGLRLSEEGVADVGPTGEEWVPWTAIRDVQWAPDHALVYTDTHVRVLDRRYRHWRDLAHMIDVLAGHADAEGRFTVPPETITQWLGIPPDGRLVCRRHLGWYLLPVAWAALAISLPPLLGGYGWTLVALLGLIGLAPACGRTACADMQGVTLRTLGRARCYAWAEFLDVMPYMVNWRAWTRRGAFSLSFTLHNSLRLFETAQKVVAARRDGLRLPTTTPPPEGALSRPDEPATDQRGLSRADDPTDRSDLDGSVGSGA